MTSDDPLEYLLLDDPLIANNENADNLSLQNIHEDSRFDKWTWGSFLPRSHEHRLLNVKIATICESAMRQSWADHTFGHVDGTNDISLSMLRLRARRYEYCDIFEFRRDVSKLCEFAKLRHANDAVEANCRSLESLLLPDEEQLTSISTPLGERTIRIDISADEFQSNSAALHVFGDQKGIKTPADFIAYRHEQRQRPFVEQDAIPCVANLVSDGDLSSAVADANLRCSGKSMMITPTLPRLLQPRCPRSRRSSSTDSSQRKVARSRLNTIYQLLISECCSLLDSDPLGSANVLHSMPHFQSEIESKWSRRTTVRAAQDRAACKTFRCAAAVECAVSAFICSERNALTVLADVAVDFVRRTGRCLRAVCDEELLREPGSEAVLRALREAGCESNSSLLLYFRDENRRVDRLRAVSSSLYALHDGAGANPDLLRSLFNRSEDLKEVDHPVISLDLNHVPGQPEPHHSNNSEADVELKAVSNLHEHCTTGQAIAKEELNSQLSHATATAFHLNQMNVESPRQEPNANINAISAQLLLDEEKGSDVSQLLSAAESPLKVIPIASESSDFVTENFARDESSATLSNRHDENRNLGRVQVEPALKVVSSPGKSVRKPEDLGHKKSDVRNFQKSLDEVSALKVKPSALSAPLGEKANVPQLSPAVAPRADCKVSSSSRVSSDSKAYGTEEIILEPPNVPVADELLDVPNPHHRRSSRSTENSKVNSRGSPTTLVAASALDRSSNAAIFEDGNGPIEEDIDQEQVSASETTVRSSGKIISRISMPLKRSRRRSVADSRRSSVSSVEDETKPAPRRSRRSVQLSSEEAEVRTIIEDDGVYNQDEKESAICARIDKMDVRKRTRSVTGSQITSKVHEPERKRTRSQGPAK